jgi:hypothetical protein
MNPFAIVAVIAVGILALAEILVSYQKSQMKKDFLRDLDNLDEKTITTRFVFRL